MAFAASTSSRPVYVCQERCSYSVPPSSTWVTQPLTTVYTPPAWCADRLFTSARTEVNTWYATRDWVAHAQCYPPFWNGAVSRVNEVFSPGVCPSGWTNAATRVKDAVTTAACCPRGMTYFNDKYCGRTFAPPTTIALNANTNSSVTIPFYGLEDHILVAWATSDLANFTPRSAPILALVNATTTLPRLSSATSRMIPSSTGPQVDYYPYTPPLSTGEKAGIGFGVALFLLLLIAAVVFVVLYIKRLKKRARKSPTTRTGKQEEEGEELREKQYSVQEIDGRPVAELGKGAGREIESQFTQIPRSIASESLRSAGIEERHSMERYSSEPHPSERYSSEGRA